MVTRTFAASFFALMLCSPAGRISAADTSAANNGATFGRELLDQAQEILKRAPTDAAIEEIIRLSGERSLQQSTVADTPDPHPSTRRIEIHVSHSLAPSSLKAVYELAAKTGAVVIFRGVVPGETLGDVVRRMRDMVASMEPPPAIEIDPTRFRKFGTLSVPRILLTEGDDLIASALGTIDIYWFREKVEEGDLGDLGVFGSTDEILEKDLIQELQDRAAAYDFEAAKRRALSSYWQKARFYELPKAKRGRVRYVDPTFVLSRDIRLPDGRVIAASGTRINPLDRMPFTQRLIVFDARDPDQVRFAQEAGTEAEGRLVTFISTGVDRDRGWDELRDVQNQLHAPVYLLPNDLAQRFRIERVPSVIDAEGRRFRVEEIAIEAVDK